MPWLTSGAVLQIHNRDVNRITLPASPSQSCQPMRSLRRSGVPKGRAALSRPSRLRAAAGLLLAGLVFATSTCTGSSSSPPTSPLPVPADISTAQLAAETCPRRPRDPPTRLQRHGPGPERRTADDPVLPELRAGALARNALQLHPARTAVHLRPRLRSPRRVSGSGRARRHRSYHGEPAEVRRVQRPDGVPWTRPCYLQRKTPPKVIVTMVWDSAGMDLLDRWPILAVPSFHPGSRHVVPECVRGCLAFEHSTEPRLDRHGRLSTTTRSG